MFEVTFEGLLLVPSASAYKELEDLVLDLNDVKKVLEQGFDCNKGNRKNSILERCLRIKNKVLRVVVVKDFNKFFKSDVWVIVHISMHSWKKEFREISSG